MMLILFQKVFLVGDIPTDGVVTLSSLLTEDEGEDISVTDPHFDARKTLFTLGYTSGSTGPPKRVLNHQYSYMYISMALE